MAISKRPLKQTADTEKAAEAFISKAGKASPANGKTPVLFRFKNDFLERIDAAARKQKLPRKAWVRTVIAEALEAKGFESEIMTSKLDELLGRQPFTPFVITTEDGDLINISNPPVRVSEAYGSSSHTTQKRC